MSSTLLHKHDVLPHRRALSDAQARELLSILGQRHILEHYKALDRDEQSHLLHSIELAQIESSLREFRNATDASTRRPTRNLSPARANAVSHTVDGSDTFFNRGLDRIADNQCAVILLAGGQGTRLGYDVPKGEISIGLPSDKSLYQLHFEKANKLASLAHERACTTSGGEPRSASSVSLPVYVMTSHATHDRTREFLSSHDHFGVPKRDVMLFQQSEHACVDKSGNLMLQSRCELARSPDGNGGVFKALHQSGALDDMRDRGILAVHVCSVDNALAPTGDPELLAHCIENDLQAVAKVTPKSSPEESVGVFAHDNTADSSGGSLCVVEYSELSTEKAYQREPTTGELAFNAANVAMHAFSIGFLEECAHSETCSSIHLAEKKVPFLGSDGTHIVHPEVKNAYKLESFIFNAFQLATRTSLVQTSREEFAPVKNSHGSLDHAHRSSL